MHKLLYHRAVHHMPMRTHCRAPMHSTKDVIFCRFRFPVVLPRMFNFGPFNECSRLVLCIHFLLNLCDVEYISGLLALDSGQVGTIAC